MNPKHRVSVGLPVFNGENYLKEELDSLLAQTYGDFELIISDNASTDRTETICREYAARDSRVFYYRNERNYGATKNFYRVFDLSSGEYFKWAAHDDVHAPEFLQRCIEVLDHDSSTVLCYPKTKIIDERGRPLRDFDLEVNTALAEPYERFYSMLSIDHWCFQIFGVVRADVLRKTRRYQGFYGWDRSLLAELSLLGKVCEFPEYLFFRREHPLSSVSLFRARQEPIQLFDPNINWSTHFLSLKRLHSYLIAVKRVQLSRSERTMCYIQLVRLMVEKSVRRIRH